MALVVSPPTQPPVESSRLVYQEEGEDESAAMMDSSSRLDMLCPSNAEDYNNNNVEPEMIKTSLEDDDARVNATPPSVLIHGGLENLGNTCYMASALQMLASAEGFVECLDNKTDDETAPLRRAVTTLMHNLRNQPVVRPELLKAAIDQQSTLFHGYRQQDANELLVTLLDLLDEEYKRPARVDQPSSEPNDGEEMLNDKMQSKSLASRTEPQEANALDSENACESTADVTAEDEVRSTATTVADDDDDDNDEELEGATSSSSDFFTSNNTICSEDMHSPPQSPMDDIDESSSQDELLLTKKARLSEPNSLNPWRSSFASFTLADIGQLLHGDPSDALILPDVSTTCIEPQYKLVGGRMNTSNVVLKPYAEYNNETKKDITPAVEASTSTCNVVEPLSTGANETITPIDVYFRTVVRIKLTCDSCKYTRHHTETFWQLSLEIGSDHVEDALRRFFAPCKQELKCEKCFCDSATQTMEIEELPPYLLLHFKRFIVDVSPDYSSISYRKDGSPVYFHDRLCFNTDDDYDATESSSSIGPEYRLISVVNHIGQSASCGHYTADAQRTPGEWKRFNDSYVTSITEKQAIDQSRHTAYMVLYRRESIKGPSSVFNQC
jgi:ubiquitin C-terminal hydrolase